MSKGPQLLEDLFEVLEMDPDGKKFDKVSRIKARSDMYEMDLTLDVNTDIYPVSVGDKLTICLASTLNLDGTPGSTNYNPAMAGQPSLMDRYDYVMHGKVFKYRDSGTSGQLKADIFVSYGGLLMQLSGDPRRLEDLDVDQSLYLLMRRANA